MARLRNVVVLLVLGTSLAGCSFAHYSLFHCDACDDFPTPAYGRDFTMMPGTYTGPSLRSTVEADSPSVAPLSSARPTEGAAAVPAPSPPSPPTASPVQGPSR
jgi:hypothetical protein